MNIKCIYLRDKLKKYIKNSIYCCIFILTFGLLTIMHQLLACSSKSSKDDGSKTNIFKRSKPNSTLPNHPSR